MDERDYRAMNNFNRVDIDSMLETQRVTIWNDIKSLFREQQADKGVIGKLTDEQSEVLNMIENCRKPEY